MSIDEIIKELEKKYKSQDVWDQEKDKIQEILSEIKSDIESRYSLESAINFGGAGIVIKVSDNNLNVFRALKFARPVVGKELLLKKIISSEISRLKESLHPNIVSIFYKNEVTIRNETWPFYIMEYIEGAEDALDYIGRNIHDYNWIIRLIQQCVEGLIFLHSHDTIHGDIKLENFLVSPNGQIVKIADLV